MARESKTTRINRLILSDPGIRPHVATRILNELNEPARTPEALERIRWAALVNDVKAVKRQVMSNRKNWPADMAPLYAEYVDIMSMVIARIDKAKAEHKTIKAVREAAERNARAKGLKDWAKCNRNWPTWVPPRIVADLCQRVEAAYIRRRLESDNPMHSIGKRLRPFEPLEMRKAVDQRLEILGTTLKRLRDDYRIGGSDRAISHKGRTPYRALHLCAIRQAERQLERVRTELKQGLRPYWDVGLSVNWVYLCEPEMRTRLRDAAKDPADVKLDGLGDYYAPADDADDESDGGETMPVIDFDAPEEGDDFWNIGETK